MNSRASKKPDESGYMGAGRKTKSAAAKVIGCHRS